MSDEKDSDAAIYSEIAAAALDLPDDAPKEKILAAIAILKERTATIIDPDIRGAVKQILEDAEAKVAADVKIDLRALKAKIDNALQRQPSREQLHDKVRRPDKRDRGRD